MRVDSARIAREAADAHRRDGRLGAAGDHHVRVAAPDDLERVADGVRRGRARGAGREFGPLASKRIDTWPAARLMIDAGMKNGEIRRGPPLRSALCSRSMVLKPPMPDAMKTPTRVAIPAVTVSPASSIGELRGRDGELNEDVHLLDVFLVDELQRVEPLHLAGDPRRELAPRRTG